MKKISRKVGIILVLVLLLITIIYIMTSTYIINRVKTKKQANVIETKIEYEITRKNNQNDLYIFLKIENKNGLEKLTIDDLDINTKEKTTIAIDREAKEGDIINIKIKAVEEDEEEYIVIASKKPKVTVLNNDTLGDGTTSTMQIEYPDIENIKKYYSIDDKETWQEYTEAIEVAKGDKQKVYAKIEYGEKKIINEPVGYKSKIVRTKASHTGKQPLYNWKELEELARGISDNATIITNNHVEVSLTLGAETCTIGVGDYTNLKYGSSNIRVRLIGFNHDQLTNKADYGGENQYAGISFETLNILERNTMNSGLTNSGGWGACALRNRLNSTLINNFENKQYIKQVQKQYLYAYNNAGSGRYSSDKLWLLSCSEIWNNGYYAYGWSIGKEGNQYKYYAIINPYYNRSNSNLVKDTSKSTWLRSPGDYNSGAGGWTLFSTISPSGTASHVYANGSGGNGAQGVAPGFAI